MQIIRNDDDLASIVEKLNKLRDVDERTDEIAQEIFLIEKQIEYYKRKDISPCPFCGKKKHVTPGIHRKQGHFYFCNHCLSSGPYGKDIKEALKFWNNRAL